MQISFSKRFYSAVGDYSDENDDEGWGDDDEEDYWDDEEDWGEEE